ncbi:serine hydrolase domain-containing protein [Marinicrinis sediminis]|uniref:Serine hydrolase domain-containing protein n=1 Tax=Marinicrinis sediminis TaxID=1652465 RepID=A0ABW5R622_9BACL
MNTATRKKRVQSFALLILLVVILSVLGACNNEQNKHSSNEEVSPPAPTSISVPVNEADPTSEQDDGKKEKISEKMDDPAMRERFSELDTFLTERKFNGVILFARGEDVLFSRAYGDADMEERVPNTTDTVFRIGSLSKAFTAYAILALQEEGKLNVNDPVSDYIDHPVVNNGMTIHQLVTHTAGLGDYVAEIGQMEQLELIRWTQGVTAQKLLQFALDAQTKPVHPGKGYHYSNTGYVVLGALIEKASGMSYADYVQQRILGPLELNHTGYLEKDRKQEPFAKGYEYDGKAEASPFMEYDASVFYSAGGLYASAEDLHKWGLAILRKEGLSEESYARMLTPEQAVNGEGYGYGWNINDAKGWIYHTGHTVDFTSLIRLKSDQDTIAIFLTNIGDSMQRGGLETKINQMLADFESNLLLQ